MTTRRFFLRNSALAMVGAGTAPLWLQRALYAADAPSPRKKILVAIFQRGAADGLNIVVPHGENAYYELRPTIAVPRPSPAAERREDAAIDLDGFFGLHPSLAPLKPLFDDGHLAIVDAAGSPDPTRSHFDAQDYMEPGTPGLKATADGWMNRALPRAEPPRGFRRCAPWPWAPCCRAPCAGRIPRSRCRTSAISRCATRRPPAHSRRCTPIAATPCCAPPDARRSRPCRCCSPSRSSPTSPPPARIIPRAALATAYDRSRNSSRPMWAWRWPSPTSAAGIITSTKWARAPRRANWPSCLREFGQALAAFWTDMGDRRGDVALVTMSEFGRTAHENGNRGTDHGHANCMFVMGGGVSGGKVYGRWPGLETEQLYEGRDLALTTDFRDVLGELVKGQLGNRDLSKVFPSYTPRPRGILA